MAVDASADDDDGADANGTDHDDCALPFLALDGMGGHAKCEVWS